MHECKQEAPGYQLKMSSRRSSQVRFLLLACGHPVLIPRLSCPDPAFTRSYMRKVQGLYRLCHLVSEYATVPPSGNICMNACHMDWNRSYWFYFKNCLSGFSDNLTRLKISEEIFSEIKKRYASTIFPDILHNFHFILSIHRVFS